MRDGYTAVIQQEDGWWFGWIEEVPGVNGQERTRQGIGYLHPAGSLSPC
jgi:predicted RNase H-like HicB family nuclease